MFFTWSCESPPSEWAATSQWLIPDPVLGSQIHLHSRIRAVLEPITLPGGKLAGRRIPLSVCRVSMKDFLCSQKTILPSNLPRGLHSASPARGLIPGTSSLQLMPARPLRAPCCPPLIPRAHSQAALPDPSLALSSPTETIPQAQRPPNLLQALSPGDSESALWFLYCKELTFLH